MFVVIFATPSSDGVMRPGDVRVRAQDSKGNITVLSHLNYIFYMARSVSGQDEPNPSLCLATRVGKMALSCPLESTLCVPREKCVLDLLKKKELSRYPAIYLCTSGFETITTSAPATSWARIDATAILLPLRKQYICSFRGPLFAYAWWGIHILICFYLLFNWVKLIKL